MHEVPLKKRAKVNFANSQEEEFTKCKYKHIVKVISINFAFDHLTLRPSFLSFKRSCQFF